LVNVIEYIDDSVSQVISFAGETSAAEAEQLFKKIVKEHDKETTNGELSIMLEDGYYEAGNYQLFLAHSS